MQKPFSRIKHVSTPCSVPLVDENWKMVENVTFPILQSLKTINKRSYLDIYTKYNILTSKLKQLDYYKHLLKFGQMSQEIVSRNKLILLAPVLIISILFFKDPILSSKS